MLKAYDVMTHALATCTPEASVAEVAAELGRRGRSLAMLGGPDERNSADPLRKQTRRAPVRSIQ